MIDEVYLPAPRLRSKKERPGEFSDAPVLLETKVVQRSGDTTPKVEFGEEVIAYLRFSTGKQGSGYSIETQLAGIKKYCERNGLRLVAIYQDKAKSGRVAARKGMREAIANLRAHPGRTMVIFNMTRFSREIDVFIELEGQVRACGCRIVSAKTGNHRRDGQVQEAVAGMVDHHELSEGMRDGKETAVLDGRWQGNVPYGHYMAEDGRIYPHPERSEVVARIYLEREKGISLAVIADGLNHDRIKSPRAEKDPEHEGIWTANKVFTIVINPANNGVMEQAIAIFDWEPAAASGRLQKQIRLKADWMRIVPHEQWEFCNRRRGKKYDKSGPSLPYALSGKVHCPHCDYSFKIGKRYDETLMKCKHTHPSVECPEIVYDYRPVEHAFWQTMATAFALEARTAFSEELKTRLQQRYALKEREAAELRAAIAELESSLDAAVRRMRQEGSRFAERYLQSLDADEAKLAEMKRAFEQFDELEPFETFYERHRIGMAEAVETVMARVPFRPSGDEEVDLLKIVASAVHRVELEPKPNGRHDVLIVLNGLPWGDETMRIERRFEDLALHSAAMRKQGALAELDAAIASRVHMPAELDLESLEPLSHCRLKFPLGIADVVHGIALAVRLRMKQPTVLRRMGMSKNMMERVRVYLHNPEGKSLKQRLGTAAGVAPKEWNYHRKSSTTRTLRERQIVAQHPLLRYPPTDPASGEIEISNSDWDALVAAGLADHDGRLTCSGHKNDRRYLNTLLSVIRRNGRRHDILPGEGSKVLMARMIRALDRNRSIGPIVVTLLRARGLGDIPQPQDVPRVADPALVNMNPRAPEQRARKEYSVRTRKKPGRKPPLVVRQAAMNEHLRNKKDCGDAA